MSDDFDKTNMPNKRRELKRPNTSDEVRTEQNFFKKNELTNLRARSPEPSNQNSTKQTIKENSKDKSEKTIIPSQLALENESDERLRYLLKYGKVKKFEQDFKAIFAELPQISGIWIFYRKQSLRNLRPDRLDFSGYKLNHVPLLEGEEPLLKYDLSNNEIQKIENLVSLPNLVDLNLSHNLIRDINGFESICQLKVLDVSYNFIESIQWLDILDKLEEVNLSHNKIKALDGLDSNNNLMVINLSYNNIVNLRSIKNQMPSVLKLSQKKNNLNELLNIENFENVKFLKLSRNDLSNYQEIIRLGKLKNQKGLSLYKNPVEQNENYANKILTVCPYLESLDHNEVSNQNTKDVPEPIEKEITKIQTQKDKESEHLTQSNNKSTKNEKEKSVFDDKNSKGGVSQDKKTTNASRKTKAESAFTNIDLTDLDQIKTKLKDSQDYSNEKIFPNTKKEPLGLNVNNNIFSEKENTKVEKEIINVEDKIAEKNNGNFDEDEINQKLLKDKSPMERVKYLFKRHTETFSITSKNSKDKEIWLGSKSNPAGFIKLTNSGAVRVVGDGIFSFVENKNIYKTMDEVYFDHILIDNLKNKDVLAALTTLKKVKSLKLNFNNITEYLELVKFECFENLVNLTIENNPVNNCNYLRQFVVYRFNNLRYFNKNAINYQDLQKAKQVFNNFDKILQLPSQTLSKKKETNLNPRQIYQISKVISENVLKGAINITKVKAQFNGLWNEVCDNLLQQSYTANNILETLAT